MHTLPLHVSRHKFGWEHFYAKNYKLLKGEALVLQDHTKDAKASKNVLKSVCIWSFQSGHTSVPGVWFPHLRLLIILRIQFKLNTALLSYCPCVRVSVRHRRDISHFSHI